MLQTVPPLQAISDAIQCSTLALSAGCDEQSGRYEHTGTPRAHATGARGFPPGSRRALQNRCQRMYVAPHWAFTSDMILTSSWN